MDNFAVCRYYFQNLILQTDHMPIIYQTVYFSKYDYINLNYNDRSVPKYTLIVHNRKKKLVFIKNQIDICNDFLQNEKKLQKNTKKLLSNFKIILKT